ncbi:transposase, partial [Terrilactibacillus laevilacticus]
LIDGKRIKSINQWYNKENKRLQSIKDRQKIKHLTKKQARLLVKRNHILHDFLNKTTRYVINHCLSNGIGKIVIGHNKEWKQEVKFSKKDKQTFVQIPHSIWMKKLESMCNRYGINFIRQEESYTSKASFLDQDEISVYGQSNTKKKFSGRRIKRGLYRTAKNLLINADLNGAANILRKSKHNIHMDKVSRGLLAVPTRIQLV